MLPGAKRLTHTEAAQELRQNKLTLFIQQFEKEAQGRIAEMEAKLDNLLTTVDKFFQVELMKMPPSLRKTVIAELINEETTASDVSIAIKSNSPEIHKPLKRVSSRKGKSKKNSSAETAQSSNKPSPSLLQQSSTKTSKGGRVTRKTRALAGIAGNLGVSPATMKRTTSLLMSGDQPVKMKPKLRSVLSTGDLCSLAGCSPHVTITTSLGQKFCLSEETKDEISVDMLDDVAMCQMQTLMRLMDSLSSKAKIRTAES